MTKQEFLNHLYEDTRTPSEKEFETITFVYNYHPSIHPVEGKAQIAMLYSLFGMRIIMDMYETAKRAQEIEEEMSSLRGKIDELKDELQELSMK